MPDLDYVTQRQAARIAAQAPLIQPRVPAVDHYDLDDGDSTHPISIHYITPAAASVIGKVTLSWLRGAFRSTANVNPSSIGNDASAESGHSHSHAHSFVLDNNSTGSAVVFGSSPTRIGTGGGGTDSTSIQSNAQGSSGHSHNHTHSLTGTAAQAVTDGAVATVTALAIDGQDFTAALGGPWAGDVVEMDITAVLPVTPGQWHTITLSLSGLGRLVSMLRLYYA